MARIRGIKPEIWTDEKLAGLDPTTRLVAVYLISYADDEGRHVDSVKLIDGVLFSQTKDTSKRPLEILARLGFIRRGKTASGQCVIQVTNWHKHQRVQHPNPKTCLRPIAVNDSGGAHEALMNGSGGAHDSTFNLQSTTINQQPSSEQAGDAGASARAPPDRVLNSSSIDSELEALAKAWNALPREQRGPDVKLDPPSQSTLTAWRRRNSNAELRKLSADLPALMKAIAEAAFCHGKGWFTFAWLFAAGKTGELNLEKLLNGNFIDRNGVGGSFANSPARSQVDDETTALLKSRKTIGNT